MEKIDRLGWAAGISFRAYGLRIGIRANSAEALQRTLGHLPPKWKPAASPVVDCLYSLIDGSAEKGSRVRRYNLLYAGPFRLARAMNLEKVFEVLESDLQVYIAERARTRLFVHAGVVGWRGRAIVIPGSSYSGKSTLVAALVRSGAVYYSDEYAVFDRRGRVHPYPRVLSLRQGNERRSIKVSPEALGGIPGNKALGVGGIVLTKYQSGKKWRPRSVSLGQAMLELIAHTVPARRRPRSALATLGQVVAGARTLKGIRGEADAMVEPLLNSLGDMEAGTGEMRR